MLSTRITRSSANRAMTSIVTNLKTIKPTTTRKKKKTPAECDLVDCHVLLEPMPKMTKIYKRPSDPPEDKLIEQTSELYMKTALRQHPDMKAPLRCVEDGDTPARPHPVGCVCNRCMETKVFSKTSPSYSSKSPCYSPPHPGSPFYEPAGADAEQFTPSAFFSNDTHTQPQDPYLYPKGSAEQQHAMQVDDDTEDYSTTDEAEQPEEHPQQPFEKKSLMSIMAAEANEAAQKKSLMDPTIEGKQVQWDSDDDDFAEKQQTRFEAAIQQAAKQETYQERRNRRRKEKRAQEMSFERVIRLEKERAKTKERKARREAEKAAQLENKPEYIEISEAEDDAEILD